MIQRTSLHHCNTQFSVASGARRADMSIMTLSCTVRPNLPFSTRTMQWSRRRTGGGRRGRWGKVGLRRVSGGIGRAISETHCNKLPRPSRGSYNRFQTLTRYRGIRLYSRSRKIRITVLSKINFGLGETANELCDLRDMVFLLAWLLLSRGKLYHRQR